MRTNTLELLEAIGAKALELHPDLNAGGCCVYASKVVSMLTQRRIKAWGVIATDAYTLDEFANDGLEPDNYPAPIHHVLVGFEYRGKRYLHDSNTLTSLDRFSHGDPDPSLGFPMALDVQVPPTILRAWAKQRFWWNPWGYPGSAKAVDTAIRSVRQWFKGKGAYKPRAHY